VILYDLPCLDGLDDSAFPPTSQALDFPSGLLAWGGSLGPTRLIAGFQVIPLSEALAKDWEQAKKDGNSVAAAGVWMSDKQYRFALGVATRTKSAIRAGQLALATSYREALARRAKWQAALGEVFRTVDIIALPTLQTTPPLIPPDLKIGLLEARMLALQNTVAVNFAGNPALAIPIPLEQADSPVTSLQLIGPRLSEAQLLNAGRLVEEAVKQ
jgi:Asp-tRNA(Asn)/Glu-tRNA(Gln) amidotransferase A subunit family amidase